MYVPRAFAVEHLASLHQLIDDIGVAHLVTWTGTGMTASVVPFLLDQSRGTSGSLVGHLARANDQWRTADATTEALAIFAGPDAYVSPSWYPSKAVDGRVVPTWNYVVVHVTGLLVVHDDPTWTLDIVRRLTKRHEVGRTDPWSVDDTPAGYAEQLVKAIVGIELVITGIEGKQKLSQNRPDDVPAVVAGLSAEGDRGRRVAAAMRDRR